MQRAVYLVVARQAVLHLLADDFCGVLAAGHRSRGGKRRSPPILRLEKALGRFWLIVRRATGSGCAEDCYRE